MFKNQISFVKAIKNKQHNLDSDESDDIPLTSKEEERRLIDKIYADIQERRWMKELEQNNLSDKSADSSNSNGEWSIYSSPKKGPLLKRQENMIDINGDLDLSQM